MGLDKAFLDFHYRFRDPGIGPAPAEVSAHAFTHPLRVVTGLPFPNQTKRAHDLARRAEPALEAVVSNESRLQRMKLIATGDALDGQDVGAVMADRQSEARIDPPAVHQDRARAALASVTSLFGSRQVQALAQKVEQGDAGVFEFDVPPHAVNGEAYGEVHAGLRSMLSSNWNKPFRIHPPRSDRLA
jgi:hypothetical protein